MYLGGMQRELLGEAGTYLQPLLPASGGAADPQSPAAAGASDNTSDSHKSYVLENKGPTARAAIVEMFPAVTTCVGYTEASHLETHHRY